MQDFFKLLLTIFAIYLIYTALFYITKRIRAVSKLCELKKMCHAKINFVRSPFSSLFILSKKPDIIIEIDDDVYLIRFINGKGSLRFLHFASPEFFVTYSKTHISLGSILRLGARGKSANSQSTSRQSVRILPSLEIPENFARQAARGEKRLAPVLIFSPAPNEITFVSESKTSIKPAFEGDDMYGQKIFTPSTFVTYTDRKHREKRLCEEDNFIWQ